MTIVLPRHIPLANPVRKDPGAGLVFPAIDDFIPADLDEALATARRRGDWRHVHGA